MPIQKVGLNLTNIQNITIPTIDIKNSSEAFLADIPNKANSITNGYFGIITLSTLFFYMVYKLREDLGSGGDFGYSTSRATGIASAVCSIIGLFGINMAYFINYYHIVIFIVITFICVGIVWKNQA